MLKMFQQQVWRCSNHKLGQGPGSYRWKSNCGNAQQGKGRETDPSREVVEELVEESGLLTTEELESLRCNHAGYNTELEETTRTGQEGPVTLRLLEVFRAELSPEIIGKLQELATKPDSLVHFVSDEEIIAGQSAEGVKIGAVSKNLLNPKDTIEAFN